MCHTGAAFASKDQVPQRQETEGGMAGTPTSEHLQHALAYAEHIIATLREPPRFQLTCGGALAGRVVRRPEGLRHRPRRRGTPDLASGVGHGRPAWG